MDNNNKIIIENLKWGLGIGDWGLGPIPNPQSPIPNFILFYFILYMNLKLILIKL